MAVAIASFSHHHFQSLPSLDAALVNYHNVDGPKLVREFFKRLFVKNGMKYIFGLAMPHRHFDIDPETFLVNYNGVSTA
ncbi:Uu.00g136400.m01.CDS01 [Anthostomella pinea]|uniref:Uu.00g136400.m01.CDS01 n=1 Tax=Anthostomella pinea TaxID=933095 RepID=A0AAI8YL47_9PEZI|nr:Uu.00g136400.m01.CDS01 [Anthostomella pinea]